MRHIFCYWIDPETMEHKPIGILDVPDGTDPFDAIGRYLVEVWNWDFSDIEDQKDCICHYILDRDSVAALRSIVWPNDICTGALDTVKIRVHVAFKVG